MRKLGMVKDLRVVKNGPVHITALLNTSDCRQPGMHFTASQAVKIFILNSSNKWNFPLAKIEAFRLTTEEFFDKVRLTRLRFCEEFLSSQVCCLQV